MLAWAQWGGVAVAADDTESVGRQESIAPASAAPRFGRSTATHDAGRAIAEGQAWRRDADAGQPAWLFRYVGSLAVVGGLLIGGFSVLRRLQGRLPMAGGAGQDLRVLARIPLDPRNSLVLVRLRGEDVLLAIGAGGANLVARFPAANPEPAS